MKRVMARLDYIPSGVNSPHTMAEEWPANTCITSPEGTEGIIQCSSMNSTSAGTHNSTTKRWYRWTQQAVRSLLDAILATIKVESQRKNVGTKKTKRLTVTSSGPFNSVKKVQFLKSSFLTCFHTRTFPSIPPLATISPS
jgi:hypothetical protein